VVSSATIQLIKKDLEVSSDAKQKSNQWLEYRSNFLTASDVAVALNQSPFKSPEDLLIEKLGKKPDVDIDEEIVAWGNKYEEEAIQKYEKYYNCTVERELNLLNNQKFEYNWLAGSPDGISYNFPDHKEHLLIEVKCPKNRAIISGHIPVYYYPQVQVQLQLLKGYNVNKAHFIQYDPRKNFLDVIEIERDDNWWNDYKFKLKSFWDDVLKYREVGLKQYPYSNLSLRIKKEKKISNQLSPIKKLIRAIENNPTKVAWLVALVGILFLFSYSLSVEPELITLSQLPDYDGQIIMVRGTVVETYSTITGGWVIYIDDNTTYNPQQISVPSIDFEPRTGDFIQATGESQRYQGEWEVACQKGEVSLIIPFESENITISELLSSPEKFVSLNVNLSVTITDGRYDSSWGDVYVKVGDSQHSVDTIIESEIVDYLETNGQLPNTIIENETVIVRALFEWNEYRMRYQFILKEEYHGIWIYDN
jgi:putative phage-type endonuclease